MKAKSWLWPDRTIGKRESHVLRDEHNAAVNELWALRQAARALLDDVDKPGGTVQSIRWQSVSALRDAMEGKL